MRKTITLTIDAEGRDKGKTFLITEMPARQAEEWALRALSAMTRAGIDIPPNILSAGLVGLATFAFRSFASMAFSDMKPLADEMMACVQVIPDPGRPEVKRGLVDTDTEEVATRLRLKQEVFELHTGFFALVARLKSKSMEKATESSSTT